MIATKGKSLVSGSDAEYVQIQAYVREDDETLHIQGRGPQVNRDYGVSADIGIDELDAGVVNWLLTVPRHFSSMAGTDKMYFILQMRYAESVNRLNFQVSYNTPTYNTPYGGNFSVPANMHPKLKTFWDRVMDPELKEGPDHEEIED